MGILSILMRAAAKGTVRCRGSGRRSLLVGAALWLALAGAQAQVSVLRPAGGPSADNVKAAYLLKFLNYVAWPAPPAGTAEGPYVIGVASGEAVLAELQRQTAGRTVNQRPVIVRRVAPGEVPAGLHVLFAGGDNGRASMAALLRQAKGVPMLLVTDSEGALEQGSMINFRLVDERVRFEVALEPVKRAGLELNSRLLSVAIAVNKGSVQ